MKVPKFLTEENERTGRWWFVAGVVAVLAMAGLAVYQIPRGNWFFTGHYACQFCDIKSRISDVWNVRDGRVLYTFYPHKQYFTYPPAALFLFFPLTWAPKMLAIYLWNVVSIASYGGLIVIGWSWLRQSVSFRMVGISLVAATAAVMVLPTMSILLSQGQTASILALMVGLDALVLRGKRKGILTGIAAAFKIYPAFFIGFWVVIAQGGIAMFLAKKFKSADLLKYGLLANGIATLILLIPSALNTFVWLLPLFALTNGRNVPTNVAEFAFLAE